MSDQKETTDETSLEEQRVFDDEVSSALYGTGIWSVSSEDDIKSGLGVVIEQGKTLTVYYKRNPIGTIEKDGQGWQAQEIDSVYSQTLDRVIFGLARHYPRTIAHHTDDE